MIAVATSAGYAGGQIGRSQPKELEVSKLTVVASSTGPRTVINPSGVTIKSSPDSTTMASISVGNFEGSPDASLLLTGGIGSPVLFGYAARKSSSLTVGLPDRNEIRTYYAHGEGATVMRVLAGGQARKLVDD